MTELRVVTGFPEGELGELVRVQREVFPQPYSEAQIRERLLGKQQVLSILAYREGELVGYKLGYALDLQTFYSWVGAVLPAHRRQGIARKLMTAQHEALAAGGFAAVRTKTRNEFKGMLILNLQSGFEIVETYTDERGLFQIVLEKRLT